jgi:hypothetical protein
VARQAHYLRDAVLALLVLSVTLLLRERGQMRAQLTELQAQVAVVRQQMHSVLVETRDDSLALTVQPSAALEDLSQRLAEIALLHPEVGLRLRSEQKQKALEVCNQLAQVEMAYDRQSLACTGALATLLDAEQQAYCTAHLRQVQLKQQELLLYAGGNLHLMVALMRRYAADTTAP